MLFAKAYYYLRLNILSCISSHRSPSENVYTQHGNKTPPRGANSSDIKIHYENTPIQKYRGGSNEYMYPQSMFLSRNKKNNVYPCKPQFYYIKVGFKGSKLYRYVFVMSSRFSFMIHMQSDLHERLWLLYRKILKSYT